MAAALLGPATASAASPHRHPRGHGKPFRSAPTSKAAPGKTKETDQKAGALPLLPALMTRLPGGGALSLDTKGIGLTSDDGNAEFKLGGRLHLDASAANLRPRSLGPALSDDVEVRRAWIEATLTLHHDLTAAVQYDFADDRQPINDALISYKGVEPVIVTVGNVKEPFSLDQLISNNNTLFLERSLLDTFAPARDFGAAVGAHGERWTLVAGVFGGNANTGIGDNGVAGTMRVTYAPILSDSEVLHIGLAGSWRTLDGRRTPASFDTTPENDLFETSLVDTGMLTAASDVARVGAEALYQRDNWRLKAEYAAVAVQGGGARGNSLFQAAYVEGGWVINGQGRPYELVPDYGTTYAILGGVKVDEAQRVSRGGIGVFELGARVSAITLDSAPVQGGREQNASLGLNWYPDKNIRVMADYIHTHAEPAASVLPGGARADSDAALGRVQFAW